MSSFFDKLKEKKAAEASGATPQDTPAATPDVAKSTSPLAPKPNPLASKANPLTPKANPLAPKANPLTAKAEAPAKATFLGDKPAAQNPFIEQKGEEVSLTSDEEVNASVEPAIEPAVEPATEPPIVLEEESKEEAVAKPSDTKELISDIKVEDQKSTEPARKPARGGKSSAKKTETVATPPSDLAPVSTEPSTSYAEAVLLMRSAYIDPEWEVFQDAVRESLDAIIITNDMNAGSMKAVIGELSVLRQQIWNVFQTTKTTFENLSSKEPEGLIERVKKTSLGDGTNDLHRKKAGIEACMGYVDPRSGTVINLYEFLEETRMRYNFLRGVMDSIKYKTDVLITMNGALKLEKDHLPAEV